MARDLFELAEQRELQAKDEALQTVLVNAGQDWKASAVAVVQSMTQAEVTGEDIRLACEEHNIKPHTPKAWGGFIASLIKSGMLKATGRRAAMRAKGSHARKTDVYVRM